MSIRKQESEVGQNQDEETVEECIARVKAENPELSDEAARAQCTNQPAEKQDPCEEGYHRNDEGKCVPNSDTEKGFRDRVVGVMKEYGETLADQVKKDIQDDMKRVVKETKDELVGSIRKGLGLEKDPVIHLSEVEGIVRKIVLNEKPHGKRSETKIGEKPTEGAEDLGKKIVKPAEEMFKDLTKNRTAI